MNRKFLMAKVLLAIAFCFCISIILINNYNQKMEVSFIEVNANEDIENNLVTENKKDDLSNEIDLKDEFAQETELIAAETPAPIEKQTDTPSPTATESNDAFAILKIENSKKTGTYTVLPNVGEDTLKDNIGWLPSSSLPGQDGLCIFMGHRDTDFRILQYVEVGDVMTVYTDDLIYHYEVSKTEIVNSDSELRFSTMLGANLVLVTCYPFYYSGHAPQKMVVYASKI